MTVASADPTRTLRRVEEVMGTVVSIDVRSRVSPEALDDAFAYLHEVDARFSPFRPDSEIERLARGELALTEASDELLAVTALCHELLRETDGAFDAWGHRPGGVFDPTGVVKGWALDGVAGILRAAGATSFAINGGGDVVVAGEAAPGQPWRVGIRHPLEADRTAAVLEVVDAAVATSGAYERGAHIIDPATGRQAAGLLSATVVAPRWRGRTRLPPPSSQWEMAGHAGSLSAAARCSRSRRTSRS